MGGSVAFFWEVLGLEEGCPCCCDRATRLVLDRAAVLLGERKR